MCKSVSKIQFEICNITGKISAANANKAHLLAKDNPESMPVIDESKMTAEQQLGLKQAEERLERDYIFRMEKVGQV